MAPRAKTQKTISHHDFWDVVARDYYRGIDIAADEFQLERNIVMAFAIMECQNEEHYRRFAIKGNEFCSHLAISKGLKSLKDRKLQILLSFGLPLLLLGLGFWSWTNLTRGASQVIVSRSGGLKAYQKISADDLGNISGPEDPKAKAFVGKYVLTDIPSDTVLTEKKLLNPDLSKMMADRVLFSLPVKGEYIDSSVGPDSKIGLMFAKNERASEATVVSDIILVGLERKGETTILVIGLNPAQLAEIKKVLPAPNVFVVRN